MDEFAAQVNGVGSLTEPTRRALYRYVVAQAAPVAGTRRPRAQACPGTR